MPPSTTPLAACVLAALAAAATAQLSPFDARLREVPPVAVAARTSAAAPGAGATLAMNDPAIVYSP